MTSEAAIMYGWTDLTKTTSTCSKKGLPQVPTRTPKKSHETRRKSLAHVKMVMKLPLETSQFI